MILCGSGIHARPDAVAFNHEIQRLTNAIKGNLIANKVNETDMMGEFFINGTLFPFLRNSLESEFRNLQHCPSSRVAPGSFGSRLEIGATRNQTN